METKKIEIEIPEGKKVEWINGVLTLVDESEKDNRPVTKRILTFEDARHELGSEHPLVEEYETITCRCGGLSDDLLAYMKLRIITASLNEGWEPQFTKDERRYFPCFVLYTQEEIDDMDERKSLLSASANNSKTAGFGCLYIASSSSYDSAGISSRLYQEDSEKAEYFGKQFLELWAEYLKFNFEVGERLKCEMSEKELNKSCEKV